MPSKRVTIKDVAKKVNVSAQTVSRVINKSPEVSPETREKVLQAIDELGYLTNTAARSLIKQHSDTIGVMVSSLNYTGPNFVLYGVGRQAEDLGYSLTLSILQDHTSGRIEQPLRDLLSRQVDGIIWVVPELKENYAWWHKKENYKKLDIPIVFMDCRPSPGFTVVEVDNRYGGRIATEHLLRLGRRNIGIITSRDEGWESKERETGWREALLSYGIQPEARQIATGDWWPQGGEAGINTLLDRFPEMDGLFASADYMALGAIRGAKKRGLRVPEDIAVVGFDNWHESEFYDPPLTTIHKDFVGTGALAMRQLHSLIEARKKNIEDFEPAHIFIKPHLVVRESCGSHLQKLNHSELD